MATVNGPNDDSDFEEEHFINELSSEDEEEDEEDIVLPLELYNIRRQQRIRDDFSISSSPLPARHNVRTRWVGGIVQINLKLSAQEQYSGQPYHASPRLPEQPEQQHPEEKDLPGGSGAF